MNTDTLGQSQRSWPLCHSACPSVPRSGVNQGLEERKGLGQTSHTSGEGLSDTYITLRMCLCFFLWITIYLLTCDVFCLIEQRLFLSFCRANNVSYADEYSWQTPQIINTLTDYCRIIIFSFCAYYQYKGNNSSHLSSTYGVLPVLVSTHLTPRKPYSERFREARVCSHPTHLKAEPAGNVVTCSASHLE